MNTLKSSFLKLTTVLLLVTAMFGSAGSALAAALPTSICTSAGVVDTCELWATRYTTDTGTTPATATLFGSTAVNIWGYASTSTGAPTLPGPILIVNQGDTVNVILHNRDIPETTALIFQGQSIIPDTIGVTAGNTTIYTFTASRPGTFLYEAGLILGKQHQTAMGMYGALVVKPADGTAYGTPATAYNEETALVLSEFDATLAANPIGFDMRKYAPKYFLINGKAYTNTPAFTGDISVTAGNKVLLRYVNAGLQSHAMATLGIAQSAIATDGFVSPNPHSMVAETIATGQTLDALVTIPASAATNTRYALYDANLMLRNSAATGLGGMLTFLKVGTAATPTDTGPFATLASLSPNPTGGATPSPVTVKATISDAGTLTVNNIVAAEFYIDSTAGTSYPMSADDAAFNSATEAVTSTNPISTAILQGLASGNHTIYVRGQDSVGNWSPFLSITLNLDKSGPATSGLGLTPNPSSGLVTVALTATGNDTATGGSNVTAAEYWVDAGAHTAITAVGAASPTRNFTASQDSFGNWGAAATITLQVGDTQAPTVVAGSLSASPSANNGSYPLSTSVPAVRVFGSFSDVATGNSNIVAAEGFIDTIGTTGTGFVFIANDGLFNSPSESGYSDIPLVVIGTLTVGNHTIYVHAKDAAGNWGAPFATLTYLIDKTAPTFTGISIPQPAVGAATVTMNVVGATDPLFGGFASGVAGGEYWFGTTVPAAGSGTPFSGLTTNIDVSTLVGGTYTVGARVHDAAGNWSVATHTTTFSYTPNAIFSNGFETAGAPWGWSSRSTTNTTRLNQSAASALAGSFGLQAQGNNTNYVTYTFGSVANPATGTFDARFYFNPNNNASTGQDIFRASTGTSNTSFNNPLFRVRYQRSGAQPQVQIQVGNTTNGSWVNINNNASNVIEVVWTSGGSLQLYVNGSLAQTLTAGSGSVAAFRMGSVTSGGSNTLEYFDAFSAKRLVSPLIGP